MRQWPSSTLCLFVLLLCRSSIAWFSTPMIARSARSIRDMSLLPSSSALRLSLQEVAQRLVDTKASDSLVCISIAGGGSHAISSLAATPGASSVLLEGTVAYDRRSFHAHVHPFEVPNNTVDDNDKAFSYVSSQAAHLLSRAALDRALKYRCQLSEQLRCVGIGATSRLRSPGDLSRPSRGNIVATRADGSQWECHVTFANHGERTRLDEDQLFSQWVLESLEQIDGGVEPIAVDPGDDMVQGLADKDITLSQNAVEMAAERIISGEALAVLLLPRNNTFVAMPTVVLPPGCLVFPGSFNPPHEGHIGLAQAAISAWQSASPLTSSSSSPSVLMELSLTNPDKPPMKPSAVSERVHQFGHLDNLPEQWGVLLTSAPLFVQKLDILRECIVSEKGKTGPQMAFVIGADTMVRILNPKYYGDSEDSMLKAVREMKQIGAHFVVGGRLEHGNIGSSKFVTGEDELLSQPQDIQDMFTLIQEEDFRADISSTVIRERKARETTR